MHTSTSPQYAIIASCDVAAAMMEEPAGTALVEESIREALDFRRAHSIGIVPARRLPRWGNLPFSLDGQRGEPVGELVEVFEDFGRLGLAVGRRSVRGTAAEVGHELGHEPATRGADHPEARVTHLEALEHRQVGPQRVDPNEQQVPERLFR